MTKPVCREGLIATGYGTDCQMPEHYSWWRDDAAEGIFDLKQQPGKSIMKYRNGDLSTTLIEHYLIDEFYFSIILVVDGTGRRLFDGIDTGALKLKLTGMTRFKSGIVTISYDSQ